MKGMGIYTFLHMYLHRNRQAYANNGLSGDNSSDQMVDPAVIDQLGIFFHLHF